MKIVALDSSWEPVFWDHALRDVPEYYVFIFNWKLHKDRTKIFLAHQGQNIVGLMLIYDQHIVQIRGCREAAQLLINEVNLSRATIQVPREYEDIILQKYKPSKKLEMIQMTLQSGEERLDIKHPVTKLTPTDTQEIANLLKEEFPEYGPGAADHIREEMDENVLYLGIKEAEELVSFGDARIQDFGGNIIYATTRKRCRGRGYATSIISALSKEILKTSKLALINVSSDNPSAIHTYTKVGFKPYRTYCLFIRGERISQV